MVAEEIFKIYYCRKCGEYCSVEYEDGYPYSNCCGDEIMEEDEYQSMKMDEAEYQAPDPFRYYGEK